VQVRTHKEADGRHRLDANDVIDAVAFIFHRADQERLPCVVNLSLNTMSGPHDGDGHFERRLRHLARSGDAGPEMKGRAVVVAAGNVPFWDDASLQWQHIFDNVSSDRPFEFYWSPPQAAPDRTRNSVEIWYDAKDAWLQVSLTPPREQALEPIGPGLAANLTRDGKVYGSIVGSRVRPEMRDKMPVEKEGGAQPRPVALPDGDLTNGRHVILLEIDPQAAATGVWKVRLEIVDKLGEPVRPGDPRWVAFHAWLERDDEGQSGIRRTAEPTEIRGKDFDSTIGTLSCGEDPIVVAAYDASTSQIKPWLQSGRGPRRVGGADKPDISAPGYRVFLVKAKTSIQCQIESGTSLAAPFVTGTIACLYEVAPQATLAMITGALFSTARKGLEGDPHATWTPCLGHGQLRPREAVARIKTMTGVDNT
jgi:subtilisin family serine protease